MKGCRPLKRLILTQTCHSPKGTTTPPVSGLFTIVTFYQVCKPVFDERYQALHVFVSCQHNSHDLLLQYSLNSQNNRPSYRAFYRYIPASSILLPWTRTCNQHPLCQSCQREQTYSIQTRQITSPITLDLENDNPDVDTQFNDCWWYWECLGWILCRWIVLHCSQEQVIGRWWDGC